MKKFSEAVLAKHKHMAKTASPHHPHSQALVYTPDGKEEIRPIDTADAGYGGEAVADAQGGEANAGKASKKAVSPMKMQTLVKTNEETERERLMKLRSFAHQQKLKGLGKAMVEEEQIDELKKSTLASYAKKATDDVSYHSFMAGGMSAKNPERLAQDKKAIKRQTGVIKAIDRLTKEEVEQVDEANTKMTDAHKKVAREVHRELKSGDQQVSQVHGDRIRHMHSQLRKKYGSNWRSLAGISEEVEQMDEVDYKKYLNVSQEKRPLKLSAVDAALSAEKEGNPNPARKLRNSRDARKFANAQLAKKAAKARPAQKYHVYVPGRTYVGDSVELDGLMIDEARRMSAAEKLGRAFDSEQQKSADSRRRAQEYMTKIRADVDAKMKKDKEGIKEENNGTEADEGEYGYEGDMAMSQLKSIIRNAKSLHDLLEPQTDLPEWVQSKITLASDYIQTAADYWRSENEEGMNESMGDLGKEKAERLLGGPVKKKSSVIGGKGQPTNLRNLTSRLATKAMKAGKSVSEKKMSKVPRVGEMEMTLEEYIDI